MAEAWLLVVSGLLVLLLVAGTLDRPIVRAARTRWPAFDYDGQTLLTWGVVALATATALLLAVLVLSRL